MGSMVEEKVHSAIPAPQHRPPSGIFAPWGIRLLIFAAAVSCVFGFRALLPARALQNESTDYQILYEPVARRILEGHGPITAEGKPATDSPPGFPILLAGVFGASSLLGVSEATALVAFAAVAVGLASLLLFDLATSLWPGRRALLAPLALMTYPLLLWFVKQPNSEIPFLPFLIGTVLLFWSAVRAQGRPWLAALACGVAAGATMLIRPIALALGCLLALLAVAFMPRARVAARLGVAGLILVGNLLIVLPWEGWVYWRTGELLPLSTSGASGMRGGLVFAGGVKEQKGQRLSIPVSPGVRALVGEVERHYSELHSAGDVMSLLMREGRRRPAALAELIAWKLARSWYATDSLRYETAILAVQLPYLVLLIWGLAAAGRAGGDSRQMAAAALLLLCSFWGMALLTYSIVRYMVPVIGLSFALLPALARPPRREMAVPGDDPVITQ